MIDARLFEGRDQRRFRETGIEVALNGHGGGRKKRGCRRSFLIDERRSRSSATEGRVSLEPGEKRLIIEHTSLSRFITRR